MNTTTIRTTKLAALALAMLVTNQSNAALSYSDGNLILGFRATGGQGGNTNYLVNLGSAATFRDATAQLTLSLGNIDADLDTIFGGSWNTRVDLNWSISGVQSTAGNGFGNRTLFATRAQGFPNAALGSSNSTPWARASTSTQGPPTLKIAALGTKFGTGTTGGVSGTDQMESTNAPGFGLIQPHVQTNSFEEFMSNGSQSASGSSYAYFSGGIEGSFANGASGSALDLYFLAPLTGGGPGVYEGSFSISNNAAITFTPTGVPEPGSALMLAMGCAALLTKRRRQQTA